MKVTLSTKVNKDDVPRVYVEANEWASATFMLDRSIRALLTARRWLKNEIQKSEKTA